MFDNEPYGYDTDGDGWLDGPDRGSFYDYDFDGDGDIDATDDFWGDMMMHEAGACFIATAVYGDYEHPQVRDLRRFRDEVLMRSATGREFVRWYYRVVPGLVSWVEGRQIINKLVKYLLNLFTSIYRKVWD